MAPVRRSLAYFRDLFSRAALQGPDPDQVLRTRVLIIYSAVTIAIETSWAFAHLRYGLHLTALAFAGCALAAAGVLIKLSLDGKVRIASHLILCIATLSIAQATFFTGGLRPTNVTPFFMIIVGAFFLLGRRGIPWALASIACALCFELASRAGYTFRDHVPEAERATDALITWLSSAVVVFLFAIAYEEARVLAERRLRAASEAKTLFLANISHELRTPLHALVAGGELLEETSLDDQQRALVEQGRRQAAVLGELIDDLLDVSALESGRFTVRPSDFSPAQVVEEVVRTVTPACEAKGLRCACTLDPDLPALVRGDPRRLRQILLNLASNAVKFTDQGEVRLRAASALSPAFTHACQFTVTDTGVGIRPQDLPRIFASFTQLDGSLARPHEGAGLGLYIAQQLARHMGGTIGVQSVPGRGSTFRLELPFAAATSDGEREAPSKAAAPPPLRVLLVEDNSVNEELARRMLEKLGHTVLVATSGREGIARCAAERPDVVLMDIQMPGMSGLEAMRAIRADERVRGVAPVVMVAMSGRQPPLEQAACDELGVSGALVRPFTRDDLERALVAAHGTVAVGRGRAAGS